MGAYEYHSQWKEKMKRQETEIKNDSVDMKIEMLFRVHIMTSQASNSNTEIIPISIS